MSAPVEHAPEERNPSRLDVVTGVLSVLLVGGFFVDLWAHSHGRVDESFFTPWHAILYASAGLFGGVLLGVALRGRRRGAPIRSALPPGYGLSLIGAGLFLAAGLGDLVWHEMFGIEESVDALLSPTHLALAASGFLMVFGPVRSAWFKGAPTSFPGWLPWVAGMTMGLSILGAFTEYAHPAIDAWPEALEKVDADRSDLLFVSPETGHQIRVPLDDTDQAWMPDFAPDGRMVASIVIDDNGQLVTMDEHGVVQQVLHQGSELFHHADWSYDGAEIAYTADVDGNPEIFLIPAEGGDPTRLTDDPAVDWGPSVSPDGLMVVFISDRDGDPDLYLVPSVGGTPQRLTDLDGFEGSPAYSPDGEWIAFETDASGNADIALIRPDGTGLVTITDDQGWDIGPAWSPDGSRIAFTSDRTGDSEIFVMNRDGSDVRNLTRNPGGNDGWAGVSWSPDAQLVAGNVSGHTPFWADPFVREAMGVAALLVQAGLIAGFLLMALRHGPLPIGSLTVLIGVSGSLMTVISDQYRYIAVALAAGVAGDLVFLLLKPSPRRPPPLRAASMLVPAIWYSLYLTSLAVWGDGLGWSIHMILGAPLLAAIVGLLLSLLAFPGTRRRETTSEVEI